MDKTLTKLGNKKWEIAQINIKIKYENGTEKYNFMKNYYEWYANRSLDTLDNLLDKCFFLKLDLGKLKTLKRSKSI